jgi:RimJ/RimL family protein N-acetyltransferase
MENFWKGNKVRLRAANADDYNLFINTDGDFDTETARRYDYIDFPLSNEQISKKIESYEKEKTNKDDYLFVIETLDHKSAGFIITFDCDSRNGTFKYGLFMLEEYQGCGMASQAAKIMLSYYFNELRYNKANVYIYDYNVPSIKFHEKLGFKYEGRLRQMAFSNGEYHDTIFYGLLKDEFNTANPLKAL